MTIHEAIVRLDALKHNTYSDAEKRRWLSQLDGIICNMVLDTHEGGPEEVFQGYDQNTPGDTVLLIPAPYDDIYIRHLEAEIDYHNGELERYNNSALLFEAAWNAFERYWNRTHLPKGENWRFQ